jgi:SAM-dependent methyltransferase
MSAPAEKTIRQESFLQNSKGTLVDKFGVWLSGHQIRRHVPSFSGKRIGDFGCGYQASFARTVLDQAAGAVLVDVALADDLKRDPRIQAIEGQLPDALAPLPSGTLDVVMIVSVLEHVSEPRRLLAEGRRLLAPGGVLLVNVPSWRGKRYLELSAFRLGLSPAAEMDDHKMYYDVKDLWPLLVEAGFLPSRIDCFSHKLGLNTFAACKND